MLSPPSSFPSKPLNLLFKSTFISLGFKCLFFVISYDDTSPHDKAYLVKVGVFRHATTPVHSLVIHVRTVGITALDVPEPFRRANITYQSVTGVPDIYRTDKEPGIGHTTAGRVGQGACRRVYGRPTGGRPDRLHAEPPVGGTIEGHVHDSLRRGTRDSQFQTPGIVSEIIAALPIQTAGIDGKAADLTAARLDSTADVRVPGLDTPVREDL